MSLNDESESEQGSQDLAWTGKDGRMEDVNFGDEHDHEVDFSRHFSYFAYEGGHGYDRWTHIGTDFHRDLEMLKNELIPQVNYR